MEKLTEKLEELNQAIVQRIIDLMETKGVKSAHRSEIVLSIQDDEQMHNLEGSRWLTEITPTELIDNNGYSYGHDSISTENLCSVIDSIAEQSMDFRVGTLDSHGNGELYKYFSNKEDAYEHFIEVRAKIIDGEHESAEVWTEERVGDEYESGDVYNIDEDETDEEMIFNDNEGNELKVGDKVTVVDSIDLECDGELEDGTPLTVVELLELDSNYITFKDGNGKLYEFYGHRVKKDK